MSSLSNLKISRSLCLRQLVFHFFGECQGQNPVVWYLQFWDTVCWYIPLVQSLCSKIKPTSSLPDFEKKSIIDADILIFTTLCFHVLWGNTRVTADLDSFFFCFETHNLSCLDAKELFTCSFHTVEVSQLSVNVYRTQCLRWVLIFQFDLIFLKMFIAFKL